MGYLRLSEFGTGEGSKFAVGCMFTLFAIPRAFTNPHYAAIQHKAIQSWVSLNPRPEILLIGDDEGVKEVCEQYGLRHIPYIRRNKYGVPYINSAVEQAVQHASHDIICYINSDIVVSSNLTKAISAIQKKKWRKFLMVSAPYVVDFSLITHFEPGFEKPLLPENLIIYGDHGDIFAFTKQTYDLREMPEFAAGKGYFDMWFSTYAGQNLTPTIDATEFVFLFHPSDPTSTHCNTPTAYFAQLSDNLREQLVTNLLNYPFISSIPRYAFAYKFNPQGELFPNPIHRGLPPVFVLWVRALIWEIQNHTIYRRNLERRWDLGYLKQLGGDERLRMYGWGYLVKRLLKYTQAALRQVVH